MLILTWRKLVFFSFTRHKIYSHNNIRRKNSDHDDDDSGGGRGCCCGGDNIAYSYESEKLFVVNNFH